MLLNLTSFNSGSIYVKTGSSTNSSAMALTCWNFSPTANKWYYRGTAEIRDLEYDNGIIKELFHQRGSTKLTNDALYYFTIGGFM